MIGPLVVAGVCVDSHRELVELGVKDSKRHTPGRRQELALRIHELARCVIRVVHAEDIDALRTQMTLNRLEEDLFTAVIDELAEDGYTVYVDSVSTDEEGFGRGIAARAMKNVEVIARHRADDTYPVVSAASICAKVRRDEEVRRIALELDSDIGSGYPSDQKTIDFLKAWVREHGELPPHTRRSWKTAQKIMEGSMNTTLDDF